jgi:multicomponent Na+:H+ antiporter subunit D
VTPASALLPLVLASSLVPGLLIFFLREEAHRTRVALNMAGATLKVGLVGWIFWSFFVREAEYETRLALVPDFDLVLRVDELSLLFAALSAVLWLLTTVYAIGYLEGSPNRSRFFGFFSLSVTATMGIALAGNLITFFLFYEALTVATYPLVVHRGTPQALAAGRVYLAYTLGGGAVLLLGVVWVNVLAGPAEFALGGALADVAAGHRVQLTAIFALLVAGLGVKASLVPLHGWLPRAMVAPAPVSALLHAVAVVKAGAFGILRVVYDVFGIELAASLGVLFPLALVAAATVVWGSLRALVQDELKRRLAYSTVSQVSYITLGAAVLGPLATTAALVHLIHQGLMKITLFFCAGNVAETVGLHRVSELGGIGRRMPLTMGAFTLAAFGMIGVPPTAGFVTKWHLGAGGFVAGEPWVLAVLALSSVLNAAYFLPVVYAAWFEAPPPGAESRPPGRLETQAALLVPTLATGALALAAGLFAAAGLSPLALAELIAEEVYAR